MPTKQFLQRLRSLSGRTLITFHALGDVDAVASALALQSVVPNSDVKSVGGITASTRHLLERLSLPQPKQISFPEEVRHYNNIVLCDVSNPDLLGDYGGAIASFKGKKFSIDHHLHNKLLKLDAHLIEYTRSSSSEIVYDLLKHSGKKITERTALLLLSGILLDSAFFKSATKQTFEAFAHLLQHTRKSYYEVLELVQTKHDVSEKIARLKAVQSAKFERVGEFVVGSALASAFELSCASALVECGCDVAFAANLKKGRISGVKRETLSGISIGKIMEAAGRLMGGSGGGHENVGGARGNAGKTQKALEECVETTVKSLYKSIA